MSDAEETQWLTLLEYSIRTGVSFSTLRRRIKASQIPFRLERGRYLLAFDGKTEESLETAQVQSSADLRHGTGAVSELAELRSQLASAKEEIADLKTLIAFYEESLGRQDELQERR